MKVMTRKFFVFLSIAICIAFIGLACQIFIWITSPHKKQAEPKIFEIIKGQSTHQIAEELHQEDLINNVILFKLYIKFNRQSMKIQAGEYHLSAAMRMSEILDKITLGKTISYPITFPEGINLYEIADILEEKNIVKKSEFLETSKDQTFIEDILDQKLLSLEGYLFPETYHFEKNQILKLCLKQW